MKIENLAATLLAVLLISACAKSPSAVTPVAVSSAEYQHFTCSQLHNVLIDTNHRHNEAYDGQRNAAIGDAIGVFFILTPVSTVFGGDEEGDLAQLKGELLAIKRTMQAKACTY